MAGVHDDADPMRTEPFGPIAVTASFQDEDEAVRRANDVAFGLAAYLFTGSVDRALGLPAQLDAGMVTVNRFGAPPRAERQGRVKAANRISGDADRLCAVLPIRGVPRDECHIDSRLYRPAPRTGDVREGLVTSKHVACRSWGGDRGPDGGAGHRPGQRRPPLTGAVGCWRRRVAGLGGVGGAGDVLRARRADR